MARHAARLRRRRRRIAKGMAVLVIPGLCAALWWALIPRTPQELYRSRCAACHALPDLSRYPRADMAAIVRMMRDRNGARDMISDEEADRIVRYLEEHESHERNG